MHNKYRQIFRLFVIALILAAASLSIYGCSSEKSSARAVVQSSSEAMRKPVNEDDKLISVKIPGTVYEQCKKYINKNAVSFTLGTPEKEGETYVYKIPADEKKTIVLKIKKQVLDDLDALKDPSIESIKTDSDFTHITLMCGGGFKENKKLLESAYQYMLTYRAFSESPDNESFALGYSAINSETFEIISEGTYPEPPAPTAAPEQTPTPRGDEQ